MKREENLEFVVRLLVIEGLTLRKLDESHLVVSELFKMIIQISISITHKAHHQNSSTYPNK